MNHLLKLFSGKHSHLDLTEITKEDIDILAIYKALDDQTQKEIRDFIKFKQSRAKR